MKKTITYLGVLFLLLVTISSCQDEDLKNRFKKYQVENDSIKMINKKLDAEINYLRTKSSGDLIKAQTAFLEFAGMSKPYDNLGQAKKACNGFQDLNPTSEIKIPVAFLFESNQLSLLAKHKYIRFYSSIRVDSPAYYYTISAVGVNEKNEDVIDYINGVKPHIYDFANPCPPCGIVGGFEHKANDTLFSLKHKLDKFYTFTKK